MLNVQLKFLSNKLQNTAPVYKTPCSAGVDLVACIDEPITIRPGEESVLIPTGIAVYIGDPNYASIILPRSGLGHKKGLVLGNGTGLIDSDYQGELLVSVCVRAGHPPYVLKPGDSFAQLVFLPIVRAAFEVVDNFHEITTRGTGGFGSTGM